MKRASRFPPARSEAVLARPKQNESTFSLPQARSWLRQAAILMAGVAPLTSGPAQAQSADACVIRTVVGSPATFNGDGGPATLAQLYHPGGVALDTAGNPFVADSGNHRIRRVTPDGLIQTVAGTGAPGFNGDGGPATLAALNFPSRVAFDRSGNLYISDTANHRIRKVTPGGTITTVAGNGSPGFSGDGGPAVSAQLQTPVGIAVDTAGNLYVADSSNNRVRKMTGDGVISTVAGNGVVDQFLPSFSGDGGPATAAQLLRPWDVAVDGAGGLYIADTGNYRIRKVSGGIIQTVAGSGRTVYVFDGGPATSAGIPEPTGIAVDSSGNLYIANGNNALILKVGQDGIVNTVVRVQALSLAVDNTGSLYLATLSDSILKTNPQGVLSTVAGVGTPGYSGDGGPGTSAQLSSPAGVAVDGAGNLYIADRGNSRIRKLTPDGVISTTAGTGQIGFGGDGGPAIDAKLSLPSGVAVDRQRNVYIADTLNDRIRRVAPSGVISTVAGDGQTTLGPGDGDGRLATLAPVGRPRAVAADSAGNFYVAGMIPTVVKKVSAADGVIRSLTFPTQGRGGPCDPRALAVDIADYLFVSCANAGILRVAPDGTVGFGPNPGVTTALAVDGAGNAYIADFSSRIRILTPDGILSTIAGSLGQGFAGEGGPASQAKLLNPSGLAMDAAGNLYIADTGNHRIRKIANAQACAPTSGPRVAVGGVVNAASFGSGSGFVAPGEIITIFGVGLGPPTAAGPSLNVDGRLDTSIGGARVLFDGIAAPMIYASATQVSAVVPYEVAGKTLTVLEVEFGGDKSEPQGLLVGETAPAIFTLGAASSGRQAAALNADGSVNSASNAAPKGSVVALFATGEGQTNPPGVDGKLAADVLPKPLASVSVTIGAFPARFPAEVQYAGAAPGLVAGVLQVNIKVPDRAPSGSAVPVILTIGSLSSLAAVTLAVQ